MFGQSLLSGAFGGAACTTDTDQLFATDVTATSIATYQLNGVTTSIPSNTYPGTASNITYAAGKFDNAAVFNGNSSSISTSYTVPAISTQSISIWFKTSSTGAYRTLFSDAPSNGAAVSTRMQLYITPTSTFDIVIGTNSSYWIGSSNSISSYIDGNWHNIVITYSGTNVKSYIDGSLFQSFTSTAAFGTAGNQSLVFGKAGLNNVNYWNGSIDQVRIFNTALPQSAVTVLYNETVATSSSASINYVNANPNSIAYYKMSSAADQLGNYNGTATNVNFNTEGKFGFAGAFNGSSSRIGLGTNKFNSLTNLTFSCWVNLNNAPSSYEYLFDGWDYQSGSSRGFGVRINSSGNVQAISGFSNSTSTNTSSATVSYGNWTHIAVSITQSNTTFSINGNTESTQSNNGFDFHTGTTYNLGAFIYTGSVYEYFLDGKLDQIRIYDSALSAANVSKLYNEIECPAATVINSFNTALYSGNGGTQLISTVGFKPDFVWIKTRNLPSNHVLTDIVRGEQKALNSDLTAVQGNQSPLGVQFESNGFTALDNSGGGAGINGNSKTYVSWNWKGSGITDTNTDGTITSSVSANKEAGFSVVKYTGNATAGAKIGHGLSSIPELIIVKIIDGSNNWCVYSSVIGNTKYLRLNSSQGESTANDRWNNTTPTSSVFTIGSDGEVNSNANDYIAYCFASIPGYSRVGSYIGTGGSLTVYVGFEPSFVMIKRTDASGNWVIVDNKRGNGDNRLYANLNNADDAGQGESFTSTGFSPRNSSNSDTNISGGTYMYLAIA